MRVSGDVYFDAKSSAQKRGRTEFQAEKMDDSCPGLALNRSQLLVRLLILPRQYTGYSKGIPIHNRLCWWNLYPSRQHTSSCQSHLNCSIFNQIWVFQCISSTKQQLVPNILADSAKRTFRRLWYAPKQMGQLEDGTFFVTFNENMFVRECEAEVRLDIEVGKEDDPLRSKHSFEIVFNAENQKQSFMFIGGRIYRSDDDDIGTAIKNQESFLKGVYIRQTLIVKNVNGPKLVDLPIQGNFRDSSVPHDRVIVLDNGNRFYVQSQILCSASSFFDRMFNGDFEEATSTEVKMSQLTSKQLFLMLCMIYPNVDDDISTSSCEDMFIVADRYHIPLITRKCVDILLSQNRKKAEDLAFDMMKWANTFQLLDLQEFASRILIQTTNPKKFLKDREVKFNQLSLHTREKILYTMFVRDD